MLDVLDASSHVIGLDAGKLFLHCVSSFLHSCENQCAQAVRWWAAQQKVTSAV